MRKERKGTRKATLGQPCFHAVDNELTCGICCIILPCGIIIPWGGIWPIAFICGVNGGPCRNPFGIMFGGNIVPAGLGLDAPPGGADGAGPGIEGAACSGDRRCLFCPGGDGSSFAGISACCSKHISTVIFFGKVKRPEIIPHLQAIHYCASNLDLAGPALDC